ncbi:hypothetical protein HPB48_017035 [Haemaphysalis longicornis]|uniref:RING-type domain-containing protein n=1 Tax=Haemaphysalis longicornis TaxID=44386 RepID=A0A9J6FN38_HAELO|nr:hypothetical protein HPB48_017035 [Haemaphysalis longicornis]
MPDQSVSLHRVRGLVNGANWRATKFTSVVPHHLTCGLCGVISPTTFLLPCFHTLCESCVCASANDGNAVCPFDEQPFSVADCPKFPLPLDTAEKLKACCWNEPHGCTFVGTLQAVLTHYEHHCTFHAVSCPRCCGLVLHTDLPGHYRAGCHGENTAPGAELPTVHQGVVPGRDDTGTRLNESNVLFSELNQDLLSALEYKVNDILVKVRNIETHVESVTRAFNSSAHQLTGAVLQQDLPTQRRAGYQNEATPLTAEQPALHHGLTLSAGDILTSFNELKALIRDPYQDRLPALQSKMNEVLEVARDIRNQVETIRADFPQSELSIMRSSAELSRTFASNLRSLEVGLCDSLKKHCNVSVISDQVKHNGTKIDAITRILSENDRKHSDQLTQFRQELSRTFDQELRSQLRPISAHLNKMAESGTNDASGAETTGAGEMPWNVEKRLILRKLELLATDSHAYLEWLRQGVDKQQKLPSVAFNPFFDNTTEPVRADIAPFMGNLKAAKRVM